MVVSRRLLFPTTCTCIRSRSYMYFCFHFLPFLHCITTAQRKRVYTDPQSYCPWYEHRTRNNKDCIATFSSLTSWKETGEEDIRTLAMAYG